MPADIAATDLPELFDRLARGDEEAFTRLFYHYTPQLYPFVLQKVRSEDQAEEIVQDIFLKLWVYREKLAGRESPQNYLFRMAANCVRDHFRMELQRASLRRSLPSIPEHPEQAIDLAEARRVLQAGVQALPAQRRKVYELRQDGLHYDEIAARLGISTHTVKNQLVQANRFLLEFLRDRGLSVLLLILSWHGA